jgi:hypothetical protein
VLLVRCRGRHLSFPDIAAHITRRIAEECAGIPLETNDRLDKQFVPVSLFIVEAVFQNIVHNF